jgi:membrane-associated protease RseP (regulator of RpoE activity)
MTFTGEESGLLGSAHFAGHSTVPLASIVGMLNMDMVGRLGDGPLIVYGVDTAEEWNAVLEPAAALAGVQLATRGEGYGPSDHTSFYTRDIPVLHFFTNVHADYHRPSDDWQRIDADGIQKVATIVADIAFRVADRRPALTLRRGAGQPIEPGQGRSQGSDAYLGSVPDFTPVARGVKLSGVSPGSPAEKAGLRSGDILVRLGTHDVADLQGLTDALGAHAPGDTVEVRYLRNGRDMKVELTLGSRAQRND